MLLCQSPSGTLVGIEAPFPILLVGFPMFAVGGWLLVKQSQKCDAAARGEE